MPTKTTNNANTLTTLTTLTSLTVFVSAVRAVVRGAFRCIALLCNALLASVSVLALVRGAVSVTKNHTVTQGYLYESG